MVGTTRRAAIGAIGSIAAAGLIAGQAAPAADAETSTPTEDNPEVSWLGFARAWIDQWTGMGGSIILQPDGSYIIGWPEFERSLERAKVRARLERSGYFSALETNGHDAELRATIKRHQMGWSGAHYDGQVRALADLLETVPGGKDAVKALIGFVPSLGFPARVSEER